MDGAPGQKTEKGTFTTLSHWMKEYEYCLV